MPPARAWKILGWWFLSLLHLISHVASAGGGWVLETDWRLQLLSQWVNLIVAVVPDVIFSNGTNQHRSWHLLDTAVDLERCFWLSNGLARHMSSSLLLTVSDNGSCIYDITLTEHNEQKAAAILGTSIRHLHARRQETKTLKTEGPASSLKCLGVTWSGTRWD